MKYSRIITTIVFLNYLCMRCYADDAQIELFIGDVDSVSKLFVVIQNSGDRPKTVYLGDVFNYSKYEVRNIGENKQLGFLSNFIGGPSQRGADDMSVYLPANSSIFLLASLPPVDYGVDYPTSKWIVSKFSIIHESYGKVTLFTSKEDAELIKKQQEMGSSRGNTHERGKDK